MAGQRMARYSPMFNHVRLLNLCHVYSIVNISRVNFLNGFHLAVAQFLAKFDAAVLLRLILRFP